MAHGQIEPTGYSVKEGRSDLLLPPVQNDSGRVRHGGTGSIGRPAHTMPTQSGSGAEYLEIDEMKSTVATTREQMLAVDGNARDSTSM